jgi:hypothetical protein
MSERTDQVAMNASDYLHRLFGHWKRLLAAAFGTAVLFLALSFGVHQQFTATAVVTPSDAVTRDLGGEVNLSSSLASSALRSSRIFGTQGDPSTEYATILDSNDFRRRILLERNWVPILFPGGWNAQEQRWTKKRMNFNPLSLLHSVWASFSAPKSDVKLFADNDPLMAKAAALADAGGPSLDQAVQAFRGAVRIMQDSRTGFITIEATARNPADARALAQGVIDQLNQVERLRASRTAEAEVAFVRDQIAKEQSETISRAYLNVLERQLKVQMLSSVVQDYAVRTIVAPYAPEIRSAPRRGHYFAFGFVLGLIGYAGFELAAIALERRGILVRWSIRQPLRIKRCSTEPRAF